MASTNHRRAIALILGLACAMQAVAAEFTLTPAEAQRVAARQIVIRTALDSSQRRGTARAAVQIDASPEVVFRTLISCPEAVAYIPHLRVCRVREHGADDSWLLVENEIDFGWYAPRLKWTFHADLVANRGITFHQVSGDFRANEGAWELEPSPDGAHTLVLYRIYIDPPGYVPNWLARSTLKRDLPQMLSDLRRRCESGQTLRAEAAAH
jgi:hypothetical protein